MYHHGTVHFLHQIVTMNSAHLALPFAFSWLEMLHCLHSSFIIV